MSENENKKIAWSAGVEEIKLGTWRDALVAANGNITAASKSVGISRQWGMQLNKKFDLTTFAAELRVKAGWAPVQGGERKGTVLGRPKKG